MQASTVCLPAGRSRCQGLLARIVSPTTKNVPNSKRNIDKYVRLLDSQVCFTLSHTGARDTVQGQMRGFWNSFFSLCRIGVLMKPWVRQADSVVSSSCVLKQYEITGVGKKLSS